MPATRYATTVSDFRSDVQWPPVCSVVADVVERFADRIHARRTHADALILFQRRNRFVTIDVTLVPHFSGAVVDHPLPAIFAARRHDDDRAGVVLGIAALRRLRRSFLPQL